MKSAEWKTLGQTRQRRRASLRTSNFQAAQQFTFERRSRIARHRAVGPDDELLFAGMLKVELHTHTSDDPVDRIPHTVTQLIDRAAFLGYHALAITLHERQ